MIRNAALNDQYSPKAEAECKELYWSLSAAFLIIQMHFAHRHYAKVGRSEAQQLRQSIK
jgi:YidC/Oxa1 family membrane protein insertase